MWSILSAFTKSLGWVRAVSPVKWYWCGVRYQSVTSLHSPVQCVWLRSGWHTWFRFPGFVSPAARQLPSIRHVPAWENNGQWNFTLTCVTFSEYIEKEINRLSSHTHFMTPPSETQTTQTISGSLLVVTSIGHIAWTLSQTRPKQSEIYHACTSIPSISAVLRFKWGDRLPVLEEML